MSYNLECIIGFLLMLAYVLSVIVLRNKKKRLLIIAIEMCAALAAFVVSSFFSWRVLRHDFLGIVVLSLVQILKEVLPKKERKEGSIGWKWKRIIAIVLILLCITVLLNLIISAGNITPTVYWLSIAYLIFFTVFIVIFAWDYLVHSDH